MRRLHLGAAALNTIPMGWSHNRRIISQAIHEARELGVQVLCLPELALTGYGCDDMFLAPALARTAARSLFEIAPETRGLVVSVGLPVHFRGAVFDCAAVVVDGEVRGLVTKRFLAGDGVHYEPRWFTPWTRHTRTTIELEGVEIPIGDLFFEIDGVRLGHEICEDAWVAERPGTELYALGVDVILNPSASHFAFGKQDTRRRIVLEASRAFGVAYAYANLLGNESGRLIYDGGTLIASAGQLMAEGERFGFGDVSLSHAVVDIDIDRMHRARYGSRAPSHDQDEMRVRVGFKLPSASPSTPTQPLAVWERSTFIKHEEFLRAISLGLFDYVRKSRSRGFVLSLSGGADSAAVATLVRSMVDLSVEAIGLQSVIERLGAWPALKSCESADALCQALLTCVYQSTRNSSDTTQNAARGLAESLQATFYHLDVDPLVESYRNLVEDSLSRELSWQGDDIALQNIQSRVRAPGVWMLANLSGALLLSTSNRSEAAVGYATMDGDTSGGLAPIAGIDKAFLRDWLRWMETDAGDGLNPNPALRAINEQAPTAELRPAERVQKDEDDLMPYEVLDAIERWAIGDKHFPADVLEKLAERFPDAGEEQRWGWVERFFQLWSRNQWKRERYAPSFHVDDQNLDPKTWCRFPILSAGFAEELEALRRDRRRS